MDDERTRRDVLGLAGVGGSLLVAGCVGGGSAGTPSGGSTTDDSTSSADATTSADTTTDTQPTMSTVFHFAGGSDVQPHAIANVSNLLADDSVDLGTVALVANGPGIKLAASAETDHAGDVRDLLSKGVAVYACENSMKAFGLKRADLIDGVEPVPSGVGQLTKLQAAKGYAYIKTP